MINQCNVSIPVLSLVLLYSCSFLLSLPLLLFFLLSLTLFLFFLFRWFLFLSTSHSLFYLASTTSVVYTKCMVRNAYVLDLGTSVLSTQLTHCLSSSYHLPSCYFTTAITAYLLTTTCRLATTCHYSH